MPSDSHVFDELKLPFIFVPYGAPEPTEWLARHPDYIKLPATFEPRERSDSRADRSSGNPPPTQRRSVNVLAATSAPTAAKRLTGNAVANGMTSGSNETADRASIDNDPIAAYLRASDALATAARDQAPG